jgi:alpha-tubulin suppressor-like RCC1 family protein
MFGVIIPKVNLLIEIKGQIGLGNQNTKGKKTEIGTVINDGASGDYHTVFSLTSGQLYVTGLNNNGQIGMEALNRASQVTINNYTRSLNVLKIWAGASTTFLLTTTGLYVTGDNRRGALGLANATIYTTPVKHTFQPFQTESIIKISSARHGGSHTFVLTLSGLIYAFGANNMGQVNYHLKY